MSWVIAAMAVWLLGLPAFVLCVLWVLARTRVVPPVADAVLESEPQPRMPVGVEAA